LPPCLRALGHIGAITVPTWFGFQDTSHRRHDGGCGRRDVPRGVAVCPALRGGQPSGQPPDAWACSIVRDDILGFLYRLQELAPASAPPVQIAQLKEALKADLAVDLAVWTLSRARMIDKDKQQVELTAAGLFAGKSLIRSHRLWETYLCDKMGYCGTEVHRYAHQLEHFTDAGLQDRLGVETGQPGVDPHQREIPKV
jgi:manganese/zinc/iron transport system permease protein